MNIYPTANRLVAACLLLLIATGCSDPEPEVIPCPKRDGSANPGFVTDRELQKIIDFYQLTVLKNTTRKGSRLTCGDIPGTYRLNNPELVILSTQTIQRSKKGISPEVVGNVSIPTGQQVVIVVEAVAKDGTGNFHIIGRGCAQDINYKSCSTVPVGYDSPLAIDVIATTGAACAADTDCEKGMRCNKGANFMGGYCAKIGCSNDGICPPGAVCVSDQLWGGLCGRKCSTITDCKITATQGQMDCVCRLGPTTAGQALACLHPQYNTKYSCGDGGI